MKAELYRNGKLIETRRSESSSDLKKWATRQEFSRLIITCGEVKSFYIVNNNKVKLDFVKTTGGY